jgi:tetratricopeptide (TPR) repeat protein
MKRKLTSFSLAFLFLFLPVLTFAQLTTVPNGGNKKASVSEQIGLTNISIHYNRPGVKGREGKIWGTSVAHYGLQNLGFGTAESSPWRAGANENTYITLENDVKIEGKPLAAGSYGIHMILGEDETTVVFSKNYTAWGSFFYNPEENALQVTVKNQSLNESVEWLRFSFVNQTENSADIALDWEKRRIAFKVEVDLKATQLASFKRELQGPLGFDYRGFVQAAQYCVQNNFELDQALVWAEIAVSTPFIGEANFATLSTKAQVLAKLGKMEESEKIMKEAIPFGAVNDIHMYARQLLGQKKVKEAFDLFQMNYKKEPKSFMTNFGLARGYSAKADFKNAQKYMKVAVELAPDPGSKQQAERLLDMLINKKDIN